jgi:hypothetical protein
MKRVYFFVWALALLIAPALTLSWQGTGAELNVSSVQAATSDCDLYKKSNPDGSASTTCSKGSGLDTNSKECSGVKIGLPILNKGETCIQNNPEDGGAIIVYLRLILRLLSGAVGLVIVMLIVIAGVQYIASTGDPAQVKAAKTRLQNAIIGLVLFASMFAILTFIIPGGIL